jgi:glycine hydroxymethyltransferase
MYDLSTTLEQFDHDLFMAEQHEIKRQQEHVELIASENYASPLVMAVQRNL